MNQTAQQIAGTDALTEVTSFLKNAARYIHQGNITRALEEILHAREIHPSVMHLRAYEEYVRSMLTKQRERVEAGFDATLALKQVTDEFLPVLDKIVALALNEIRREAAAAEKQKEIAALQQQKETEAQREAELRAAAIAKKISVYLSRAREFREKNDFHNALNELARAFILDPTDHRIKQAEEEIKRQQEERRVQEEREHYTRRHEERQQRRRLFEEWQAQRQKEQVHQRKQEEEGYKKARERKIHEYLQVAQTLFSLGKIKEALSQIAFVLVIDPLNEAALELNKQYRNVQISPKKREEKSPQQKKAEVNNEETVHQEVQIHLDAAKQLLKEKRYSDARKAIAQARVAAPDKVEITIVEQAIAQAEESESRQREEEMKQAREAELHRLAIEQQQREIQLAKTELDLKKMKQEEDLTLNLSKARGYLSQYKFEEALRYLNAAFRSNPFDQEVMNLQREIIETQKKSMQNLRVAGRTEPQSTKGEGENVQEVMGKVFATVEQYRQQHRYKDALDTIAQAYKRNPLNNTLPVLEREIQQEYVEYEERERRAAEIRERELHIKKSLANARESASRESYGEAMAWIEQALSVDKDHAETMHLKTEIERLQRSVNEQKVLKEKEQVVQTHLNRAKDLRDEKRTAEALFEVELALWLQPDHPEALKLRSQLKGEKDISVKTREAEKSV
jgi:hypothetical protein